VGGEACLVSNGERAYFTGDALHDPVQVTRPELHLPGCDDPKPPLPPAGPLLRRINDEGALLFPARFSWPHYGHLAADGDDLVLRPGDGSVHRAG
jgi:hypothetical protein